MARTVSFEGKVISVPDDATDAEVSHILNSSPPMPKNPGILARVKDAVIAPEGERDKSFGEALYNGVTGIPAAIGKDFRDSAAQFNNVGQEELAVAAKPGVPLGAKIGVLAAKPAMSVLGMALSPITGTAKSLLGRPVEQATGVRREIVGDVASAFVPLGGEASLAKNAAKIEKATAALKPGAAEAHAAGYVLPPKMISDKPGLVANTLAGMSGKIKTAQAAAEKNQAVTNSIAAKDLGLAPDAPLTEASFDAVRAEAGKAYEAVKTAIPAVKADEHYLETVHSLGGANSDAALHFPGTMKNQGIADLVEELSSVKDFPTSAGMELVKELRSSATSNLKAIGDRGKHQLGLAQRQAADAMDGLIERNIEQTGGDTGLVKAYKDARQLIAKSYDVEGATNLATGDVNALGLARLANKGKPMSGGLGTIAKAAQAFPQAMKAGVVAEPVSALDFFGAAALAAHGNPKLAGMMLARPVARATVLSKKAQNALVGDRGATNLDANALRRAPAVNAFSQMTQAPQN